LHHVGGHAESYLDFSRRLAVDHRSVTIGRSPSVGRSSVGRSSVGRSLVGRSLVDFSSGRAYNDEERDHHDL
jgi:hypothetical protein